MVHMRNSRHVVLRVTRYNKLSNQVFDTIVEHNAIQKEDSLVNLTKFGKKMSQEKENILKEQIKEGRETFLFLVYKEKNKFKFFRSKIHKLVGVLEGDEDLIDIRSPTYYKEISMKKGVNFILSEPLQPMDKVELYMDKTNKPIEQVLSECRTALLFVRQSTN